MRIQTLKRIVKNSQAEKIDGVLVDVLTAHALLMCWEAGNDSIKERIATADIAAVGKVAVRACSVSRPFRK